MTYILPTTSRYLDFPSLVAFSSSHPSLSWLWPDFYDFTVSRNMLKVKDAADVVLMNNFLADFPVEEVSPCEASLCHFVRCYICFGQVRLEVTWRDVGIRLRPLSARLQYKVIHNSENLHFLALLPMFNCPGYGRWGYGGGDRPSVQTDASSLELEGFLPQRGSLQPQVQHDVKDRRQALWGEEDVSGGDRNHCQFQRSHQVKSLLMMMFHCLCSWICSTLRFSFNEAAFSWMFYPRTMDKNVLSCQRVCNVYTRPCYLLLDRQWFLSRCFRRRRSAIPRFAKLLGPAFFLG